MNTDMTWQTVSISSEQTEQLAEKLGHNLRGGEVIEFVSDLGGGKTTFTRGLVRGSGSSDRVASPTFTISREYSAPKFTIVHFDFYRLTEAGIVANEIAEVAGDSGTVVLVEWGEIVHGVLPLERLTIQITQLAENERRLNFQYPEKLAYLLENITP